MSDQVLPSKLIAERILISFDFSSDLQEGESAVSWEFDVEVFSGIDPAPELLLYQVASRVGPVVSQKIHQGLPGVIYRVMASLTGSTGTIYQQVGLLAVLPTPAINPPINALFLTSRPYPVDITEGMSSSIEWFEGRLQPQPAPMDGMISALDWFTGELRDVLQTYDGNPEGIQSSMQGLSGELRAVLIQYAGNPEGIQTSMTFGNGVLQIVLVIYNIPAEGIRSTLTGLTGAFS